MKFRNTNGPAALNFPLLPAALIAAIMILAPTVFGQRPRPTPTPKPVAEVPEIISLADDESSGTVVGSNRNEDALTPGQENKGDDVANRVRELGNRVKTLESARENEYDRDQRRLLLNLDILTRAEQRSESLRKQLFEMIEKEAAIKTKLDGIDNDLRPEMIERSVAYAGSLRPEELRNARRTNLESEKRNLQDLLAEISKNKLSLQENVEKADSLVEKLRVKLEKEIDEALADEDGN